MQDGRNRKSVTEKWRELIAIFAGRHISFKVCDAPLPVELRDHYNFSIQIDCAKISIKNKDTVPSICITRQASSGKAFEFYITSLSSFTYTNNFMQWVTMLILYKRIPDSVSSHYINLSLMGTRSVFKQAADWLTTVGGRRVGVSPESCFIGMNHQRRVTRAPRTVRISGWRSRLDPRGAGWSQNNSICSMFQQHV